MKRFTVKKYLVCLSVSLLINGVTQAGVVQCAQFGKPNKARPVNSLAMKIAKKANVVTCESEKFILIAKGQGHSYQLVNATADKVKAYQDYRLKRLMKKNKDVSKLW